MKLQQLQIGYDVGFTVYKINAGTPRLMVVVEWKSPVAIVNKTQQSYLLFSRVVSRNGFVTLTPLTSALA